MLNCGVLKWSVWHWKVKKDPVLVWAQPFADFDTWKVLEAHVSVVINVEELNASTQKLEFYPERNSTQLACEHSAVPGIP